MKDGEFVPHAEPKGSRLNTCIAVFAVAATAVALLSVGTPIGEALAAAAGAAVESVAEVLEMNTP